MKKKMKVVLAYSGGLDTSVILKWLQDKYNAEVITGAKIKMENGLTIPPVKKSKKPS